MVDELEICPDGQTSKVTVPRVDIERTEANGIS